jgi:hypothetical protein
MEISQDEPIFTSIDNIKKIINGTTDDFIIQIHNDNGLWSETEFNNFLNTFKSSDYVETVKDEYLEITDIDNITLRINKLKNILLYCNSNNYKTTDHLWYKKTLVIEEKINDLFDINMNMNVYNIDDTITEPTKWDDNLKRFKLIKEFSYIIDDGVEVIGRIIKDSITNYATMKKSRINNTNQIYYEFELKIVNMDNILINIIKTIQALFLSKIVLTKKQQASILEDYRNLVAIASQRKSDTTVYLLTPKPVALKKINLENPDNYGVVSILRGYTVTEKADGERLLLYINGNGDVYTIDSSKRVEGTGIKANKDAYNSLIDGEYVHCNKRIDGVKRHLYAAFDIYFLNGEKLTSLPLMDDKHKCRYNEMLKLDKLLDVKKSNIDFMVKKHNYSKDIYKENKNILTNHKKLPYEIDGLIFTPAKLAVYSYYPTMPVEIKTDMTWNSVFKWKPPEQNTIDFLIKFIGDIKKDGLKYRKYGLYVTDKNMLNDYNIKNVLNIRYKFNNFDKLNSFLETTEKDIFKLFVPNKYYINDSEFAFVEINTKGEVRAENNDKIDNNTIVEFRYDLIEKRWIPIRVRTDKTRIYNKGIFDKTANSVQVALDTWDTIHNMISASMIIGNIEEVKSDKPDEIVDNDNVLETDDIYYERNVPFNKISNGMLLLHMLIKSHLYNRPQLFKPQNRNQEVRGALLEMACGQAGDLNNWKYSRYTFVLGIDLVKSNIYTSKGSYSRLMREHRKQLNYNNKTGKNFSLLDMAFAVGDCTMNIKTGEAAIDPESRELLKMVMNPVKRQQNLDVYERALAGKGKDRFNVISCMFAIHYFFETETKLEQFLKNVSDNLQKDGLFFATFMDGSSVELALSKSKTGIIEGRKDFDDYSVPVWAIIKQYKDEKYYNKKIDVFIENTQKLITEFLVNLDFLIKKAKEFDLELEDTELFSETYEKIKKDFENDNKNEIYRNKYNLYESWRIDDHKKSLIEFEDNTISKSFSFLNRWVIFKKI